MIAEIDFAYRCLKVAPRVVREKYALQRSGERVGPIIATVLHDIGNRLNLSPTEIARSHFPSVLYYTHNLFARYDELVDNSSELPSIDVVRADSIVQERQEKVVTAVAGTDTSLERQQLMLGAIDAEAHFQYALHCRYGVGAQPLSSNDAFTFKEVSGGSIAILAPRLLALSFGLNGANVEAMLDAGYWYGAIMQLIDDVADIGIDLGQNTQNAFRSCLYENPDELEKVRRGDAEDHLSYKHLQVSAPRSLEMVRERWDAYYGNVLKEVRYPLFQNLTNSRNMGPAIDLYSWVTQQNFGRDR